MKTRVLAFSFLLFISMAAVAQTYTGAGGVIPDNGDSIIFSITVSGLVPATLDTIHGLESVKVEIQHPYDSDLDVQLVAPNGVHIPLVNSLGNDGDNFWDTRFDNNGYISIIRGEAPFTGIYRPIGDPGIVNKGQNGNGVWKLYIRDVYAWADQGNLVSWELKFGNYPSKPRPFSSSVFPIVYIDTRGKQIVDEPKTLVRMGIIDNGPGNLNYPDDPWNDYNAWAGIEYRGSSSQMFPKKPYGFETWDSLGAENEVSILGMPEETDWILSPGYSDKAFLRNVLSCRLANQTGHYASRTRYCELFVNGQYQGVYTMMEKIKRDKNRVDIKKLDANDTSGVKLTGGYILKIDKFTGSGGIGWTSPYPPEAHPDGQTIFIQYEYPKAEDIKPQQEAYIQNFVNEFETTLASPGFADTVNGYAKYIDPGSFIDYFLVNEISRNIDGYRLSAFFYKQRDDQGGKLVMGPVWDYDIAWHNADYCNAWMTDGWAYKFGDVCPNDWWQVPFWWSRLLEDTSYANNMRCRWEELRTNVFNLDNINTYIDSVKSAMNEGPQQRNYFQWPILGYYVWPNPYPYPQDYAGEIESLKTWIAERVAWLDANIPGDCPYSGISDKKPVLLSCSVAPNPCTTQITLSVESKSNEPAVISIVNLYGSSVRAGSHEMLIQGKNQFTFDVSDLPAGFYYIEARGTTGTARTVFIKQ
jgi:subtilisin-like proprotein convertase family protein